MDGSTDKRPQPKLAASVILLRDGKAGPQVYLLRRHRKSGFMASSFVFPGGICDEGESQLPLAAARELFEEAGVLLSNSVSTAAQQAAWRDDLNAQSVLAKEKSEFIAATLPEGLSFATQELHYFSHWITPSVEKRRYSATFYVAKMPEGQQASPDNVEMVDDLWVTPAEALQRAKELQLPPPQIRIFLELLKPAQKGISEVFAEAQRRSEHRHSILPTHLPSAKELTLLLPWDPDYNKGQGESLAMPATHPIAWGPSRFVRRDDTWLHTTAEEV